MPGALLTLFVPLVIEGFPYTMLNGVWAGRRLTFSVDLLEPWQGWCAPQTPSADGSGTCILNRPSSVSADGKTCTQHDGTTGTDVPIDCTKLLLCGLDHVCTCDSATCSVTAGTAPVSFDLGINSSGSVVGEIGSHDVQTSVIAIDGRPHATAGRPAWLGSLLWRDHVTK